MEESNLKRYRFISLSWSVIYAAYGIVHVPFIIALVHFLTAAGVLEILTQFLPVVIAFGAINWFAIMLVALVSIAGALATIKFSNKSWRSVSVGLFAAQISISAIFLVVRLILIGLLVRALYQHMIKFHINTQHNNNSGNTPKSELEHIFTLNIVALFMLLLSLITEIVQTIFSSIVIHSLRKSYRTSDNVQLKNVFYTQVGADDDYDDKNSNDIPFQ